MLPGQRPGRLRAQTIPLGGRRTGRVPPRRRRPRPGAEAAILRRRSVTPPLPKGRTRSRCWPTLLHRVSRRPLHCRMAPAQVAFHRARPPLPRPPLLHRSSRAAPRRIVPMPALACQSRRSPLRRRSRRAACSLTAARAAQQPGQRGTQPAILSTAPTNPRHGATFRRLSGAMSGYATEDAAVIGIRSPGAAAPRPICCRLTTCCRSPRGVARSRPTWFSAALLITACATATGRLRRRSPRCSASSALLPRRSTALTDGSQVARRAYTSQLREPSVQLRYRLFRPWPVAVDALVQGVVVVYRQRIPAACGVRTPRRLPAAPPAPRWRAWRACHRTVGHPYCGQLAALRRRRHGEIARHLGASELPVR